MKTFCPYCALNPNLSDSRIFVVSRGFFRRKSDSRLIRRFHCKRCLKNFSASTLHSAFRQKKRNKNEKLRRLLASGISLRRSARELGMSRTTIARKLLYLGKQSRMRLYEMNQSRSLVNTVEFDDQETFEHTKCKPLSITLAVESGTRWILGFEIGQMNAKGHLTKIAFKKYGRRKDTRAKSRKCLFASLKNLVVSDCIIKSDENPHYPADVKLHFPKATHLTFKGQRGSIVGQGELKKVRFDPLFSLNHTCAMTRANINRLFRKTWCTTKIPERLSDHFAIYAVYHNENLQRRLTSTA